MELAPAPWNHGRPTGPPMTTMAVPSASVPNPDEPDIHLEADIFPDSLMLLQKRRWILFILIYFWKKQKSKDYYIIKDMFVFVSVSLCTSSGVSVLACFILSSST